MELFKLQCDGCCAKLELKGGQYHCSHCGSGYLRQDAMRKIAEQVVDVIESQINGDDDDQQHINEQVARIVDPDNDDIIILEQEDDMEDLHFEQIATIPYNDELYAVMKPIDIEGLDEDVRITFLITLDDEGDFGIEIEHDKRTLAEIEKLYDKLFDE